METVVLKVSGMETEKDPKKVRRAAKQFEGVSKVTVNQETGEVEVGFEPPATLNVIKLAIEEEGFTVSEEMKSIYKKRAAWLFFIWWDKAGYIP